MSNGNWTKGEWAVNGLYIISRQNEEDYIRICQILSTDADARLIAAAPDLLKALKNLLEIDMYKDEFHNDGRAAIANAKKAGE